MGRWGGKNRRQIWEIHRKFELLIRFFKWKCLEAANSELRAEGKRLG